MNYFFQKFLPPLTARIWLILYVHTQPHLTSIAPEHQVVEELCGRHQEV